MLLGFLAVYLGVLQAFGLLSDPSSEFQIPVGPREKDHRKESGA